MRDNLHDLYCWMGHLESKSDARFLLYFHYCHSTFSGSPSKRQDGWLRGRTYLGDTSARRKWFVIRNITSNCTIATFLASSQRDRLIYKSSPPRGFHLVCTFCWSKPCLVSSHMSLVLFSAACRSARDRVHHGIPSLCLLDADWLRALPVRRALGVPSCLERTADD